MNCGLLGEKLGHSYSPAIHARLGDYAYRLYEKTPEELDAFLRSGPWDGLNVTIPYKKTVPSFCTALSDTARRIGSVNTLLRLPGGGIYGDNTDAYGFRLLLRRIGIDPGGRKALVFGSGGASAAVCAVLEELGAESVTVVSRSGEDNYGNLTRHADAQLIVNATPVGMYPRSGEALCSLADFPRCEAVADLIYNPARTALLMEAEARGVPHANGLSMLVAQAKRSAELFTGRAIDDGVIDDIERALSFEMQNVVLVGMPGCGKSTLAHMLAEALGRDCLESDAEVERAAGKRIPAIFAEDGEEAFRALETRVLAALGKRSGAVIATGGGCVTRAENYPPLHRNGVIVWLQRRLDSLPKEGRPISLGSDLAQLYEQRRPLYERFADFAVSNDGAPEDALRRILEILKR